MPGIVKIGQTTRDPKSRVREISRATGVPYDFEIVYDEIVSDVDSAERLIHSELSTSRISRRREFFKISIRDAIKTVQAVASKFTVDEGVEANEIEILPQLETRMRRWLRREIVSVKFVQFSDLCLLRVTEQPDLEKSDAHQTAIDLRVLGGDEEDGLLFSPRVAIHRNVEIFLELDPYSMIMVGIDLLSDEAADYVVHLVEQLEVEPPLKPGWRLSSIKYDMWGSAVVDNSLILDRLHEIDSQRLGDRSI